MLLKISNLYKTIGNKDLFEDLSLIMNEGEKVALIGRNGLGKTTLFKLITKEDKDYTGDIQLQKDSKVILTRQEHFLNDEITALEYILSDIPEFLELKAILNDTDLGEDIVKIEKYTDTISKFSELGFYEVEDKIISSLESFGVSMEKALGPMQQLSGGEKRFVELVRVMYSKANLALIDEPTNHMDYIGKENFITWLKNTDLSMIVITHDRDVLKYVDRIIELKDKKMVSFTGNYDAYLKQNSLKTVSSIDDYELKVKQLEKLKKQVDDASRKKARFKAMKILADRLQRQYDDLKAELEKPSFWIDKESIENLSDKVVDKYEKYKEKNIKIHSDHNKEKEHKKELLRVDKLSVGYTFPLFENIHFTLNHTEKVFIKGRNGAGKSTLIKTIIANILETQSLSTVFKGDIKSSVSIKLGVYEQEIDHKLLSYTLKDAITKVYDDQKLEINDQKVKALLNQYLFDPIYDGNLHIKSLSGGQKARFQIIKMLSNKPNLLILDEPTNHLDLPSIEVLENALSNYSGAILYITHDNYLIEQLGGDIIEIGKKE